LRSVFHVTLYRLRRALARPDCVLYDNEQYAFNHAVPYWYDVEAFEGLLAQADAVDAADPLTAATLRSQAVALYGGDFLEDLSAEDDHWALVRRESLLTRYLGALKRLGAFHETKGQFAAALDVYARLVARESYDEAAHQAVMRCHQRLGDRPAALRHYRIFVKSVNEELGVEPLPETTSLYRHILRGAA
jgi:DNA-binding SARP family transcriptional activator